jgi:hypothetical protein
MIARKLMGKGCETYLTCIIDTMSDNIELSKLLIVKEFLEMFLEELQGLSLEREVEVSIDLLPGITPIAQSPYRMTPIKLAELKIKLHELFGKGFICLSNSP